MSDAPSQSQDKFIVRLPDGMRDRLRVIAEKNNRSMNAEVVSALQKWIEDEDYHAGLVAYYSANPPETPPEGWQDEAPAEWPSEDFLLGEKERQIALVAGKEAAERLIDQLRRAGILPSSL